MLLSGHVMQIMHNDDKNCFSVRDVSQKILTLYDKISSIPFKSIPFHSTSYSSCRAGMAGVSSIFICVSNGLSS